VGTVAEALEAHTAGADVLVVQGAEAGGHGRGARSLFGLIPAARAALPGAALVAAGGINDRAGYEAARALGADGVALGTRFYATPEALDSDPAKKTLLAKTGADTVRSRVYDHIRGPVWPEGFTGRTLRTRWTDTWAGREPEMADDVDSLRSQHLTAVASDDMTHRVVFAGDGLDGIATIEPAASITRSFPVTAES
jgi:nitronate monooxygenase